MLRATIWRELFRHHNFKKWSELRVLCAFWHRNVLRTITECNFWKTLIWPAGSAPAALASLLFDPPEPQITGKTQCFATFLPFRAPGSSLFWDFLFFDLLSSSLLFSDSSHLCFSSVHIVGSLTSKLPSITHPNGVDQNFKHQGRAASSRSRTSRPQWSAWHWKPSRRERDDQNCPGQQFCCFSHPHTAEARAPAVKKQEPRMLKNQGSIHDFTRRIEKMGPTMIYGQWIVNHSKGRFNVWMSCQLLPSSGNGFEHHKWDQASKHEG